MVRPRCTENRSARDGNRDMNLGESVRSSGTPLVFVEPDSVISLASGEAVRLWGRQLEGADLASIVDDAAREGVVAALQSGSSYEGVLHVAPDHSRVLIGRSGPVTPEAR